ncbi:MAG: aspartate carbamoyltransferase regulatory subunit [Bacteroidaceae bacterium]|nr:aspartate carbamoyltransferase regulatory subunit [Bacteroidaceae bacterium]
MKRQELQVAALENGTVIDHIPSAKLFAVVSLLHLEECKTAVTVGFNLKSKKMGHKSIIKIANKFFTDEELNQLAVITPNVSLCIIRDYEVVEKKTVRLSDDIKGIIKCNNPKCITNNEPMYTRFHVLNHDTGTICCHYCNTQQHLDEVKLC